MANPNPPKEHLKPRPPWKKGQSGNPDGYSRGRRQIDGMLALIDEKGADGAINAVWLKQILSGDFRYFKEYIDRRDGKVPDKIETKDVTAALGLPIPDDDERYTGSGQADGHPPEAGVQGESTS